MTKFDQIERSIQYNASLTHRIVSLVPSLTETLCDLGLSDSIIAVTKFCLHPEGMKKEKIIIGGTKNPRLADIKGLEPTIIIANKEENRREDIEALAEACTVYVSDIQNIYDLFHFLEDMGCLFQIQARADACIRSIRTAMDQVPLDSGLRCAYMIWKNPWMVAGGDSFIDKMLSWAGYHNIFNSHFRYPTVELKELQTLNLDILFLSSEPYPFSISDAQELSGFFPNTIIQCVDGEAFSWYGSRLKNSAKYINELNSFVTLEIQKRQS